MEGLSIQFEQQWLSTLVVTIPVFALIHCLTWKMNYTAVMLNSLQKLEMEWIKLDVGGTQFSSQRSTLTSEAMSNLARMVYAESKPCMECCTNDVMQNTMSVSCSHIVSSEERPILKIDCDPAAFSVILNFLRHGVIAIPPYLPFSLVMATASSLGLVEMGKKLEEFEKEDQTNNTEWLKLNVGGQIFETTRSTLTSHPTSSLAKMFQPNSALSPALMEGGVHQV